MIATLPPSSALPALAALTDDELRAQVRFVHRAIGSRGRLGWTADAPPLALSALCVAIGDELERRGASPFPCPTCRADLEALP